MRSDHVGSLEMSLQAIRPTESRITAAAFPFPGPSSRAALMRLELLHAYLVCYHRKSVRGPPIRIGRATRPRTPGIRGSPSARAVSGYAAFFLMNWNVYPEVGTGALSSGRRLDQHPEAADGARHFRSHLYPLGWCQPMRFDSRIRERQPRRVINARRTKWRISEDTSASDSQS